MEGWREGGREMRVTKEVPDAESVGERGANLYYCDELF